MKYLLLLLFLFSNYSLSESAKEFSVDMTFLTDAGKTDIMNFGDQLTYRHFKGTASWRDSAGDYGTLKCLGNYVSSKEYGTTLNNYCQGSNKDGDVFWLTMVRKSTDYDGGIGQSEYIYGEGKFNSYVGLKCIYAVEISKEFSIVKQKCKIE